MIIQVFRDKSQILLVSHLLVNHTQIQALSLSVALLGLWDWCWRPYFACSSHKNQNDLLKKNLD